MGPKKQSVKGSAAKAPQEDGQFPLFLSVYTIFPGSNLLGIYHVGVIYGSENDPDRIEIAFDKHGIHQLEPQGWIGAFGGSFVRSVPICSTNLNRGQFIHEFVQRKQVAFGAGTYNIMTHNCHSFARQILQSNQVIRTKWHQFYKYTIDTNKFQYPLQLIQQAWDWFSARHQQMHSHALLFKTVGFNEVYYGQERRLRCSQHRCGHVLDSYENEQKLTIEEVLQNARRHWQKKHQKKELEMDFEGIRVEESEPESNSSDSEDSNDSDADDEEEREE